MKEYTIKYESFNVYEENVSEAVFDFRVLPCNDGTQVVANSRMYNSIGESIFNFRNLFGFEVNRIRALSGFKEFSFTLNATVQKITTDISDIIFLPRESEIEIMSSNDFFIEHHLFLQKTAYTSLSAYNRKYILLLIDYPGLFDYLISLNKFINSLLTYKTEITDVTTTADDALNIKSGVCQDYAHLFISMCRQNGIPSRYISGYLNQGKDFIGNTLMHAWTEAFIPGVGWMGFDPTNNLRVDENYIKVSHGADYTDCAPIKGVLKTKGENKTSYKVVVTQQQQQSQQQ